MSAEATPLDGPVPPGGPVPPAGTGPIVELAGLSVGYRQRGRTTLAVEDVDLTIAPGETVAVVGESGSGKTTTANAILGLLPSSGVITAGRIRIAGTDVTGAPDRVLRTFRGNVVGLVPQDPMVGLNPTMRIGGQIAEVVRRRGVDKRLVHAEVIEALERAGVDQPAVRARQYPGALSGGLRQRVLIAIAIAGHPRLIVADEPTSALDVTVQRRILDHLGGLVTETGASLLIITHDLGVAADRADRVVVMQRGRIVEQGEPEAILLRPREPYTRHLIAAAPALSHAGGVVPHFTGVTPAPEVLRLDGIGKDFRLPRTAGGERTFRALDDVTLSVRAGQTLGLVGESGSGKTTALRIAMGLEKPTQGRVHLDGVDITDAGWSQLRPLRRRFQLVHQNPYSSLDPRFTVAQTIAEPLVSFRVGDRASRAARVRELLDQVALPAAFADRKPAELSGGQRQRVAIARALALEPELVFLDEPVSALDVSVQEQILTLLLRLQADLGVGYLFISHDLAVVAQLAHHVAVLRAGRIVESGPAEKILTAPAEEHTRELLGAVPGQRFAAELAAAAPAAASHQTRQRGTGR
ncbi:MULTISPECIES: dipeptide ABC transporter ATP-binding protein [Frankia]|uniref:ABC transport protein, ATPase component n=2 Tax=Frankia TaxID=1854 RepID=Q0RJ09_FRAAA|nr:MULTISPECIES: ABC transporter ATP-binding protein [Frankia]CAJ62506.1 putative ABC transport protein, ATPase component [Frankia alni ACN14a]